MNIREAILKAADSIEQHPHLFNFDSVVRPDPGCGTPGCAIGWIGYHLGAATLKTKYEQRFARIAGYKFADTLDGIIGIDSYDFYDLMKGFNRGWRDNPSACADALRQYADAYHPAEHSTKHHGIPESVRELFEVAA